MGLTSSMHTALTGMRAAETQIDVTGNNLANSQTTAFKASETIFASQFYRTSSLGSAPSTSNGGTNPRQVGLGVQVAEIRPNFSQGTIQMSSTQTDLALQGNGFFILRGTQGEQLYTRAGNFELNAANQLVSATGNYVLGFGADSNFNIQPGALVPLSIPLGLITIAEETENVTLAGNLNLDPAAPIADTAEIVQSASLGNSTIPAASAGSTTAVQAGTPDTSATTSSTAAGTSGFTAGQQYEYVVAFVDDSGRESFRSNAVTASITANNQSVTLNSLPSTAEYTNNLNVYRRLAGTTNYQQVGSAAQGGSFLDNGAAPTTTLDQTTLDGTFQYRITFTGPGVPETRPSNPLTLNVTNGRAHIDNLPAPPAGYTGINLYRNTLGSPAQFYLVDSVTPGNDYTDYRADSDISNSASPTFQQLSFTGPPISSSTLLTDVIEWNGASYSQVFQLGNLDFNAEKGGAQLDTKQFNVQATSTVGDLVQFMNDSMGIQLSNPADPNPIPSSIDTVNGGTVGPGGSVTGAGRLQFVGNNGVVNAIDINNSAFSQVDPTTGQARTFGLGFSSTQQAAGEGASVSFVAYDSVGAPADVRVNAVLESRNGTSATYRWFADSGDNDPLGPNHAIAVGTGLITFDGQGNVLSTTNTTVTVQRQDIPSVNPLDFNLDLSQLNGLAGPSLLAATRQDGAPPGTLTSFSIGEDGLIRGIFSNGLLRNLGQVRLANFANPHGLDQRGENLYAQAANSGLPVEGNPGQFGIGEIVGGATELSNTDVGDSLVDLILASTQYRSNSRVISTAQQLLDEILNLRR